MVARTGVCDPASGFALNARDLGLLAGGFFLGFSATQLPLGRWLDRHGPKQVSLCFLAVAVLGCVDFATLAKDKSQDPGSAKNGGDLSWFEPGQMVKPFGDVVKAMEKGTYAKTPVQSQFGWHIIKLEDTRDIKPPEF